MIETARLRLRLLCPDDADVFAALKRDPEVMRDLGGPIDRAASDAKLARFRTAFARHGVTRWAIEGEDGGFVGYCGVMPAEPDHPLGPHFDIGWRLARNAWGLGYATEAARAALDDAFTRAGLSEVLAYTSPENLRSQAVMARLGLERDPSRDYTQLETAVGRWRGLVWVARPK